MSDERHRTPDWSRLRQTEFFQIQDWPGEIVASATSPGWAVVWRFRLLFMGIPVMGLIVGHLPGLVCGLLLAPLLAGIPLATSTARLKAYADEVRFRPEGVYGFRGKRQMAFLPREAMQQIVADADPYGLRSHRFVADVGYFSAFPGHDPTDQLLMNNILLAAFEQPLHLDLAGSAPSRGPDAPGRSPMLILRPLLVQRRSRG